MTDLPQALRDAAAIIEDRINHEHGLPAMDETRQKAGEACVKLCHGDADQARTLWRLVTDELGYMPLAAAVALIRASRTENLVPEILPPDLDAVPR